MSTDLRNFLAVPYDELEELNLKAKKQLDRVAPTRFRRSAQVSDRREAYQGADCAV
jgi:hypothetical protein